MKGKTKISYPGICALLFLFPLEALPAGDHPDQSPGPYPVGVRTVVLVDPSRRDAFAGGPRTLVTEIWYPAREEARKMPRARFSEFFGPYQEEAGKTLRRDLEDVERRFQTLAARDAVLRKGRWPLLVFSHGNGGFRHQNAFQMDHLASHGFVVAAPDHTGNSRLSPLPSGAVGYDRKGRWQSARDRPLDIRFLMDQLSAGEDPQLSWLAGSVDPGAIGLLGHSFGGLTVSEVGAQDSRIKAILPMTVALGKTTEVPTLVMLGAQDRTVGLPGNMMSRGYFLSLRGPRYLFVLRRGGHFTFTDMAVLDPNFGDGVGRGKGRNGKEMEFIPNVLSKKIINAYTLAFFERYLRLDKKAKEFIEINHWPEELEWWIGDRLITGMPSKRPAFGKAEN